MGCVGFHRFFSLYPQLICRSSTASSRLSLLSLAITASLFCSRHHTPRLLLDLSLPKSLQFQQQRSPFFPKASTHDQDVFNFYEDEQHSNGFEEVFTCSCCCL